MLKTPPHPGGLFCHIIFTPYDGDFCYTRTMRRIFLMSFILLVAASCRPLVLQATTNVSGPPEYRLGWEDGCDSGLSAQGGFIYKYTYGFKKRPEMSNNTMYTTAWNEGFAYCRFSLDPVDKSQWFN